MWETLFRLTNVVAMLGWAVLFLGPPRLVPLVRTAAVGLLCVAYVLIFIALFGGLVDPVCSPGPPPDLTDYSVRGLRRLFEADGGIVVGWTHYLALDLFTGTWIVEQAARRGWTAWRRAPVLFLTLMAGPAGLLAWLVTGGGGGCFDELISDQMTSLLPSMCTRGRVSSSTPSMQRTFIDHPSNGTTPASNSADVGLLGRRKGMIPHVAQK